MTPLVRGLRGDLRLALRPACLVILVGIALIAGLSSAITQSTASEQLGIARTAVDDELWTLARCGDRTSACQARARADDARFLADQRMTARQVAALQTPAGIAAFAAGVAGLGAGAVTIALLATLVLAGEWSRGTMGLALAGGIGAAALALRRFVALALLGLLALGAAAAGAAVAAVWGAQRLSLPPADAAAVAEPLAGALVILVAYSAISAAIAWAVRDPLRTLLLTMAGVGLIAATTPLGPATPGAAIASAAGIQRRLEFELGYVWIWPDLTFSPDGASPLQVIDGPRWGIALVAVAGMAAAALLVLGRRAIRADPLA